jgi:hypothetical protein
MFRDLRYVVLSFIEVYLIVLTTSQQTSIKLRPTSPQTTRIE